VADELAGHQPGRLFSRVRSAYGRLSGSERKVADYIFSGRDMGGSFTISAIASATEVSESTLVRFSRKLEFDGFAAFKRAFLKEILAANPVAELAPYQELTSTDDDQAVIKKLFALMHTALEDTFSNLRLEDFREATRLVAQAKAIEIFAHGGSASIAQSAVNKFLILGTNCVVRGERFTHELSAGFLGPEDVAIALSHTGETQSVAHALGTAGNNGVPTIAITGNSQSPIARAAQLHLLSSTPGAHVGSETGVTRVAQVAVLDCLAVAAAQSRLGSSQRGG
jgi:DNA-binding MurR/RpiR family transcriptional regulator